MRAMLVAGIVLVGTGACAQQGGDAESAGGAAAASTAVAPAPREVRFVARDFAFDGPDTIPAGMTTFVLQNDGPGYHHIQLVRLEDGMTLADLEAAAAKIKPGDTPPPWLHVAGGVNPPDPGAQTRTTFAIEPGDYAVVCFVDIPDHVPHLMKGMARALTVTASDAPAAAPPTEDLTLTLADYSFSFSAPPTAGRHVVKVVNGGPQPHEVVIFRLKPGMGMADFQRWGETFEEPVPVDFLGGPANMAVGQEAWVPVDLTPGDYILTCFYYDAGDGMPHIMHGMLLPFTVA